MHDLVSIIIPAYNQGHFLGAAIESALGQTYPNVEVIVVDDGSTDDTPQVAAGYAGERLRVVRQANAGLSAARNTGIRHARGKFLSYLDSDDQFLPEKIALLMEAMQSDPQIGLVAGQAIPVDEQGNQIGRIFDEPLPAQPERLLLGNPLHVGSVLVRQSWQERAGFFDERLRSYEDWDMWLRLGLLGCGMRFVSRPVSLYRFHGRQMTRDGRQMTTATFAVLDNLFARTDLPQSWLALRPQAYAQAHLRAAAQSFHAAAYEQAHTHLRQAVEHNPQLAVDNGKRLAGQFSAWVELPKTPDPLGFLERIYANLPPDLAMLSAHRGQATGELALRLAFEADQRSDVPAARRLIRRALAIRPAWWFNRGALAVFLRAHIPMFRKATASGKTSAAANAD